MINMMIGKELLNRKDAKDAKVWFWVFPRSGKTIREKANGHACQRSALAEFLFSLRHRRWLIACPASGGQTTSCPSC
ncbi:MAG: hypothetical protein KKD47_04075 [Proteobacteria bacterium]|nr:hypothetical protein [Pseudomonadota bacterium]